MSRTQKRSEFDNSESTVKTTKDVIGGDSPTSTVTVTYEARKMEKSETLVDIPSGTPFSHSYTHYTERIDDSGTFTNLHAWGKAREAPPPNSWDNENPVHTEEGIDDKEHEGPGPQGGGVIEVGFGPPDNTVVNPFSVIQDFENNDPSNPFRVDYESENLKRLIEKFTENSIYRDKGPEGGSIVGRLRYPSNHSTHERDH